MPSSLISSPADIDFLKKGRKKTFATITSDYFEAGKANLERTIIFDTDY
jgi:hypothetical protein